MSESTDLSVVTSLARHLAFSPVAFAVTGGPAHDIRYANAAFRQLESEGEVAIGHVPSSGERPANDLRPLLDRVFRRAETVRDELLVPLEGASARWRCTVWPLLDESGAPDGLVLEVRDAALIEGALSRQRSIAERLLLGALRDQDAAREAVESSERATFLAAASRDLALSLDQNATRELIQRRALPRPGTWCIVDIIESNGALHRLAVVHPDPAKQALARTLADRWGPKPEDAIGAASVPRPLADVSTPTVITHESGDALVAAAHGPENLAILREIGFGALLVVPLVVRATALGAITFVTPPDDHPFTADEIALASDLADRCAMALDNARLYHEADALRAEADVASRAKSTFLGNMSHELMTPLNAIGGYAELIEMGLRGPVSPEQQRDLTRIKMNQQHLLVLISEILTFVRSESGRMEYRFREVNVQAALTEVAELLEGAIASRRLWLDRPPGDESLVMWADVDRVRQILMNLVMNAVKYTPAGGGPITLTSSATTDSVHIHVDDSGVGIPHEKLGAVFDPFVQLTSGMADRQGGVGLGLAISRDLARAMHGDLTVESTDGVGSRFTLTLPRARPTSLGP